jgi:hypothetical protein
MEYVFGYLHDHIQSKRETFIIRNRNSLRWKLISWPGYLDNSVAGGIPSGLTPLESIIKECAEEASLDENEVRARLRPAGCVSYLTRSVLLLI